MLFLYLLVGAVSSMLIELSFNDKTEHMPVTFYIVNIFCWPVIVPAYIFVNYIK